MHEIGLMKKGKQGRIISVSSLAHKWTKELDLDNLNSEKKWEPKLLYGALVSTSAQND